jgi:hypothetical protein
MTQKPVEVPPILRGTPDLLDSNFQLAQDRNAGCKTSTCESPLFEPVPNEGVTRYRLA